jgi:hypothetical protein
MISPVISNVSSIFVSDYLMLHVIDLKFAKDFYRFLSWKVVVGSLTCVASSSDAVDQQRCPRGGGWKTERERLFGCVGLEIKRKEVPHMMKTINT